MVVRTVLVLLACLGLVLTTAAPVLAAETVEGKVVAANATSLTITDKDNKRHVFSLAPNASVSIDGEAAKPNELKAGQQVKVTYLKEGEKLIASKIEAKSNS